MPDAALDYARAAIRSDPIRGDAHNIAISALFELGRIDAARAALAEAKAILPNAKFVDLWEDRIQKAYGTDK